MCIDNKPLLAECEWYRRCFNGKYVTSRCPLDNQGRRQIFNPVTKNCTENMKLSIDDKCYSYRECIANDSESPFMKWTEIECEGSDQYFDQNKQECVNSADSTCGLCFAYFI